MPRGTATMAMSVSGTPMGAAEPHTKGALTQFKLCDQSLDCSVLDWADCC